MRQAGHVARMGEEIAHRFCVGQTWSRPLRRLQHRRRIILKWILKKWYGRAWAGFNWLEIGRSGGIL